MRVILALLLLTADESVVAALHNGLLGHAEVLGLSTVVTLCELESLSTTLVRHGSAFNTSHVLYLLCL